MLEPYPTEAESLSWVFSGKGAVSGVREVVLIDLKIDNGILSQINIVNDS